VARLCRSLCIVAALASAHLHLHAPQLLIIAASEVDYGSILMAGAMQHCSSTTHCMILSASARNHFPCFQLFVPLRADRCGEIVNVFSCSGGTTGGMPPPGRFRAVCAPPRGAAIREGPKTRSASLAAPLPRLCPCCELPASSSHGTGPARSAADAAASTLSKSWLYAATNVGAARTALGVR
jgi:hypothetical protein